MDVVSSGRGKRSLRDRVVHVEVLAIELLNELQHHSVDRTFVHLAVRAEAFEPRRFPSLLRAGMNIRKRFTHN